MSLTKLLGIAAFVAAAVIAFVGVSGVGIEELLGIGFVGAALVCI